MNYPALIYVQQQPTTVHTFAADRPTIETVAPLYTRDETALLPGVAYQTIGQLDEAWRQFQAERAAGVKSAWKVQRRVYLRGQTSQERIRDAVEQCWWNKDLLLLLDGSFATIAVAAARHYVVPYLVAGKNARPRCGAKPYERVIGNPHDYLMVLADVCRELG